MKLMKDEGFEMRYWSSWVPALLARNAKRMGHGVVSSGIAVFLLAMALAATATAQAVNTTTVQGTVYLANGQPGAGTLTISWPAFTTAAGQAVAADSTTVTIPPDGFVSVNLAPNVGATPAGEYYTAVYYMSGGSTSTQYWVVPAAAQASLAQVQSQVMPAAQAVQAVSKAYVDQAIAELAASSGLSASGGTLSGPLYLSGDPTQPLQAADKHYVDTQVATAVPLAGGNMTGALTTPAVNGVQSPTTASAQTTLQAAMNAAGTNGAMVIPPAYAGTDTFTNPNGVKVTDLRTAGAQQAERSVKEFGAVCDGVTDDTNALQAAISYANAHGVALTIPQGTCKTRTLSWHGESIGGLGKQVSALMGFPGQDVLASGPDATNMLSYTRLHDLTIYVDQSVDVSCTPAQGRAVAGSCQMSRPMEANSIFSPGGNGLTGTAGTGAAWDVGNCAIAMQAATGAGGNGLRVAEIENVEIAATGVDLMAAQYAGAHSTHTCGMYLAQWPQWSEFRNIDIRGLNTGIAIPALPVTAPAGLNADSNRWQNVTIQAAHALTAAAGSNNVLDNVVALAGNSSATGEPPTGLVLDLSGSAQGWTVRNAVVMPAWYAVQPALTVTAAGGAVTAVTVGSEHGLGWDPYGTSVPVAFSGSCTAQAAAVNANGSIASVTLTQGGVGCSATTTASLNAAGTWDTAAPVNLIGGQDMTFFAGNLLKGNGGYTVWNAANSASNGTQLDGGGGTLPGGGAYAALVANSKLGSTYPVDQFPGADIGAKIQACVNAVNASYGGTCDARNFTGSLTMGSNLTIATGNVAILLPCATIATANQIVVAAGARNVALRGCALRGGTAASGSIGGTVFAYSGAGAMVQVGDPAYAADTPGFHMDNVVINTTGDASATAQGFVAYRTQELNLESLYFLGNSNQTGMTLDGTGNYTGGTFLDNQFGGFGTAVNAIGHQVTNPATTDWMNASTFVRLHIDCPTSSGDPISGTYGINLQQGDGNTFTGGDVEGCSTALHLGPNAQNNTIVGLRNENSTSQVVADAGSAYNNWITGGTMFTGKLTDSGTRNSFLDTFHRSFNALNGDWYGSQQDATLTNHFRLGIGAGNERGLLNEIQTDYGYRWLYGFSDGTGGQQLYQLQDLLNNVYRLQIQQWNNGQSSTNNQTALNAAGTGNVCFNCSTNSGTGGVTFASGGTSPAAVATVDHAGDAQFVGTLQIGGTTQSAGTVTARNNADAEVDYYLWPGLTTSQKGSFTYKDWNGNSQWYLVKDVNNNWALNSATGGLDSFKAYQSTNSGDTYIDASNSTGHIRLNYEPGSGAETDIYSGPSASLDAAFLAPNSIKFPGLAASSGDFCLQVDDSGYITNTGSSCGSGSGSGGVNGTINSGSSGQIAYYTANGTAIGGMSSIPLTAGGTGANSASSALANLLPGTASDGNSGITVQGDVAAAQSIPATSPYADIRAYGAVINSATDIGPAVLAALAACPIYSGTGGVSCKILLPCGGVGCYWFPQNTLQATGYQGTIEIDEQGSVQLGGTLSKGPGLVLKGEGGGHKAPDVGMASGTSADIVGANVAGTLGTAITSTNTAATFTPTFNSGQGSIANFVPNISWITVVDPVTVTTTGNVTSTAWGSGGTSTSTLGYNVTATMSAYTRIAPGSLITVAGCANSAYNVTNTVVVFDDYAHELIGWGAPTLGAGSTTGCTITGTNQDTFESVGITAVSGSTLTASFQRTHSASAQWGMVGVVDTTAANIEEMDNINISGAPGAEYVADATNQVTLESDGFLGTANVTSVPADISMFQVTIDKSVFESQRANHPGYCNSRVSCPAVGYSSGALRITHFPNGNGNASGCGSCWLTNNVFVGGVEIDSSGASSDALFTPEFVNDAFRESTGAGIWIDNRYLGAQRFFITAPDSEDDFIGYYLGPSSLGFVSQTDPGGYGNGQIAFKNTDQREIENLVNSYFNGPVYADNAAYPMTMVYGRGAPVGTYVYGGQTRTELISEGASLGPSVIPWPTVAAPAPSSWSCSGCTITPVLAPDGTTNAAELTSSGGGGHFYPIKLTASTYAGDFIIYGGWTRQGQLAPGTCNGWGPYDIYTAGTDTFQSTGGNYDAPWNYDARLLNAGWHPVVALATIATGETASHSIYLQMNTCTNAGVGLQAFQPFMTTLIPGPNNPAYVAGTTPAIDEVERWREELMHGAVPQNFNAPGVAATTEAVASPQFDILTPSTGAVNPFSTANLSDWTDSGVANGSSILWNATAGKWTPATTTGSGSVVLASGPTLTGTTTMQGNVTLQNGANSNQTLAIQPGTSADQIGAVQFNNYSGTAEWQLRKDASNYLRLTDSVNSLDRALFPQNANTTINAGAGANAVVINNTSGSGTGGFIVYEGGSNYSTAAFQVTGSGNTTATGFLQGKFMMGTGTMTLAAGAAAGSSPTIACATSHVCDGISGTVTLTTGTSPTTGTLATLSFPNTHSNQANCIVTTESATAVITSDTWTESTTAITITANTAPAASTAYTIKYWCGGY